MKQFILGSATGLAATIVAAKLRIRHLKKYHPVRYNKVINDDVIERRVMLLHWLTTAPGLGIKVEQIVEHYQKETAAIDAIIAKRV